MATPSVPYSAGILDAAPPRAADQRASAFEDEAMPHTHDLYRTAMRLLRDASKASDAVQETYLLAWKSFDKYERGTNCRAWLFQILFNVVRHQRRDWFKWITGRDEDLAGLARAAPYPVPESLSDNDILTALDSLPVPFRDAVLLVDVQEFAYKEASGILNIPIGTVMSRLSRGRALLRAQLADTARAYGIAAAARN